MNENDGRAKHGYRNEVSWDDGKGRQPYGNREEEAEQASGAHEIEAGNRGAASGRNIEDLEALKGFPEPPEKETPREDESGRGGVS